MAPIYLFRARLHTCCVMKVITNTGPWSKTLPIAKSTCEMSNIFDSILSPRSLAILKGWDITENAASYVQSARIYKKIIIISSSYIIG